MIGVVQGLGAAHFIIDGALLKMVLQIAANAVMFQDDRNANSCSHSPGCYLFHANAPS